jgi:hypothetical protein
LRRQIVCVTRSSRSEDPQRHITHVDLGDEGGWSRVMMVEEIIAHLRRDAGARYYMRGRDGWEADVKLGRGLFCSTGHEFIVSASDLNAKDKLLTLPGCGE